MKSQLEKLQREIVDSDAAKREKEKRLTEAQRRLEKMQRVMAAGIQEKADMEAELMRLRLVSIFLPELTHTLYTDVYRCLLFL